MNDMNKKNNNSRINLMTRFIETMYKFIVVVFKNIFKNILNL